MIALTRIRRLPTVKNKYIAVACMVTAIALQAGIMSLAAHATTTVKVNSLSDDGWSVADTRTNGHVNLVQSSGAPIGIGALSLKTDANPAPGKDKAQFMMPASVSLAEVAQHPMYYSTKQHSASFVAGLPSYQVAVNLLGTSGFTTLVYEPYTNEGNAAVQNGVWQQWNVGASKFWSTRAVGSLQPSQGTYQYTLAQILAEFPDAQVIGVGVNVGSNNPNYDTEVDGFAFNDNVYDFEPVPVVPDVPTGLGFTQAGLVCGGATNSNPVVLSWGAATNATSYTYSVQKPDGTSAEFTVNGTTDSYSFGAEGLYSYKVRANGQDSAQSEWSASCGVTYDKTAPTVAFGGLLPWGAAAGASMTFSGTSNGATSVHVFIGTVDLGQAVLSANGNWTLTATIPSLPSGNYVVKAVASDAAGNTTTATPSPWYRLMIFTMPVWW